MAQWSSVTRGSRCRGLFSTFLNHVSMLFAYRAPAYRPTYTWARLERVVHLNFSTWASTIDIYGACALYLPIPIDAQSAHLIDAEELLLCALSLCLRCSLIVYALALAT